MVGRKGEVAGGYGDGRAGIGVIGYLGAGMETIWPGWIDGSAAKIASTNGSKSSRTGCGTDHDDAHLQVRNVLLVRYALIQGQQDIVASELRRTQKLTVSLAFEARPLRGVSLVIWEAVTEIERQNTRPAGSSSNPGEEGFFCFLEGLDCHFTSDSRKLPEELVQGVAALQVVDEVLERNSSAAEAGGSAHDLRVGDDHRFSHSRLYSSLISAPDIGTPQWIKCSPFNRLLIAPEGLPSSENLRHGKAEACAQVPSRRVFYLTCQTPL
jgi:hypothetical protein